MVEHRQYDLVVIGGGPGGYVAAIYARKAGMKVCLIEKDALGGVCLNWGCIPTKALIHCSDVALHCREGISRGYLKGEVGVDYQAAHRMSRQVAEKLSRGVEYLMKKNKIDVIKGEAVITDKRHVEVNSYEVEGENLLIATGAEPWIPPGIEVDNRLVVTSKGALSWQNLPERIAIVGGGAIGVEFGYVFSAFGAQVVIFEVMEHILPFADSDVAKVVSRALSRRGIKIVTSVSELRVKRKGEVSVVVEGSCGEKEVGGEFDAVVVATGVAPKVGDKSVANLKLARSKKGWIEVHAGMRTSVDGVYAVGDVVGPPCLAHVASAEGKIAVDHMIGRGSKKLRYDLIPACVYCRPELGVVGLTEKEAKRRGIEYEVAKFPLSANGRAVASDQPEGLVKLIVDSSTGVVLGGQMVGMYATELITLVGRAIACNERADELESKFVYPHPTISEAVGEAGLAALGEAIHI